MPDRIYQGKKTQIRKEYAKEMKRLDEKIRKQIRTYSVTIAILGSSLLLGSQPVFASGVDYVNQGLDALWDIVAAIITGIGGFVLLWGMFEFGTSMGMQDSGQNTAAMKRIGGGIVTLIAPVIVTALKAAMPT